MYFDRFDICEAYSALECDYNVSGLLQERPSCQRRCESVGVQLDRIGFRPRPSLHGLESLTDNARDIYLAAVERLGLPLPIEADDSDDAVVGLDVDDYTTEDFVTFHQSGRLALTVPEADDWRPHVRAHMERAKFWPNVWRVSDHGNAELVSLDD